jgi:hypothetical protein
MPGASKLEPERVRETGFGSSPSQAVVQSGVRRRLRKLEVGCVGGWARVAEAAARAAAEARKVRRLRVVIWVPRKGGRAVKPEGITGVAGVESVSMERGRREEFLRADAGTGGNVSSFGVLDLAGKIFVLSGMGEFFGIAWN